MRRGYEPASALPVVLLRDFLDRCQRRQHRSRQRRPIWPGWDDPELPQDSDDGLSRMMPESGTPTSALPRRGIASPSHSWHPRIPSDAIALALIGLVIELVLLAVWQRNGYWDFSDGVYAESARELLHGLMPYRDFAAAQPPPVYLAGAFLLVFHDGLASLRAGMALADLATAVLVGICVWRLTARRWIAVAAVWASPLIPISLHEHAQLTPESLAAPLIMLGALCCARSRRAAAGGVLLAVAASCKVAFLIPALAIAMASPRRRRSLVGLIAGCLVLGSVFLAVFGTGLWDQAIDAQLQVGRASAHYVAGLLAQAAWSELALLAGAGVAVWMTWSGRKRSHDEALMGTLIAAAVGGIVLVATVVKRGSYINVLAVAEPALLSLAACGAAWSWERWPKLRLLALVPAALLAAQSISLLANPADPWVARRPGAQSGLAWSASPTAIDQDVAAARACSQGRAYSGSPYVAFLAARRMPGDQPDLFMISHAPADARFARRAAQDQPRCP